MASNDIKRHTIEEIRAMNERGEFVATPADAPTIELDDAFWKNAEKVGTRERKASVHLRLDPETAAYFRSGGKGHLTRMANVLKAYAQAKR